jgi:hypothetical protein
VLRLRSVPRRWKVIQTVREKFSCRACEAITQPPAPFHVTPRGFAGPNLLATILFDKFSQHQPLNRQSDRFAREGIDLSVSTLADQVAPAPARLRRCTPSSKPMSWPPSACMATTPRSPSWPRAKPSSATSGRKKRTASRRAGGLAARRARPPVALSVAKPIDYLLSRWDGFARFIEDGRICLSNNAAERALRGFALGRKSWLFAGSERGADRAAAMTTLIMTARLNDIDPLAWLADVLARIADIPMSRLPELMPWQWKALSQKAAA